MLTYVFLRFTYFFTYYSKVERIKRRIYSKEGSDGAKSFENTKSIKIYFSTEALPNEIFIERIRFKVSPFVQNVRQCAGCWQFGHTKNFCKSKKIICVHCGLDHEYQHEKSDCHNRPAKCINCSLNHDANDKSCNKYISIKEINTAAAYQGISIQHARDVLRADTQNKFRREKLNMNYADVVGQKRKRIEENDEDLYTKEEINGVSLKVLFNNLERMTRIFEALAEQNNTIIKQNAQILEHFLASRSQQQERT